MKQLVKNIVNFVNANAVSVIFCLVLSVLLALACYHTEPVDEYDVGIGLSGLLGTAAAALFFLGGIAVFYHAWKVTKGEIGEFMSLLRYFMICAMAFLSCGVANIAFEALNLHFGLDLHLVSYWGGLIVMGMFFIFLASVVLKLIAGLWVSISHWAAKA